MQNIPLFKIANSPDKNARAEKRDSTTWSQMRWFSSTKIDLHNVHWNPGPNRPIFRDFQGRNILPVKNAIKWGLMFNRHNNKTDSTIDVVLIFLCKHKPSVEIELTSIVVELCLYSSSFFS